AANPPPPAWASNRTARRCASSNVGSMTAPRMSCEKAKTAKGHSVCGESSVNDYEVQPALRMEPRGFVRLQLEYLGRGVRTLRRRGLRARRESRRGACYRLRVSRDGGQEPPR